MRLEWLEDMLAVAETGSFIEAAERQRLTQSAFSRRIQAIEQFVGVELFDRTHKPVQLRPTTEAQHEAIAAIALSLRQLVSDLRRGDRMAENRIVIASQHALTAGFLPGFLADFQPKHPDAFVKLRSANFDECLGLLFSRQADIAVVYDSAESGISRPDDILESVEVGQETIVPVLASDCPLDPADPALPVIVYPSEVFLGKVVQRDVFAKLAGKHDIRPKAETALTLAAVELAARGIGVAWVPASLAARRIATGEVADLSERLPGSTLTLRAYRLPGQRNKAETSVWAALGKTGRAGSEAPTSIPE